MRTLFFAAALAAVCVFSFLSAGCTEDKGVLPEQTAIASGQGGPEVLSDQGRPVAENIEPPKPVSEAISKRSLEVSQGAVISFEKILIDLGVVAPRSDNLAEFRFVNKGSRELQITKISKTCGCTPFTMEKDNYMPGEEGMIKVKYHASSHPGTVTKRLYVESNDADNPKVALMLKAEIVEKVAHEPARIKFMPQEDNGGCPDIILRSLDGKPFSVKAFRAPDNCVAVDIDPSTEAVEFVLKPRVDIAKILKRKNGRLDIDITHPDCASVTIPYSVIPEFNVTPQTLNIPQTLPGIPVNRTVYIINNYGQSSEVESASSRSGLISLVSWEKLDSNRCRLELEIMPPAAQGNSRIFRDRLSINMVGGEKLDITCVGQYENEPESTSSVSE